VGRHQRFVLTSHVRPDSDALGSELGMAAILEQLGKDVWIVNDFAVPSNLLFLDPQQKIKQLGKHVTAADLDQREVFIILDTSAWIQLGQMADVVRAHPGVKLVIDHHLSQDDLGAIMLKNADAEATGRLVIEAADALRVPLPAAAAEPLFAAMATDTGWFRFATTNANTFRLAARLMEAGARPDQIYKRLYEEESLARLHLMGRTMARTQSELGGRLIHTWIELADFDRTGAVASDTEDLINLTLTVRDTEVAIIFVELRSGGIKVSFRSRSAFDCRRAAEQFGGGGHRQAAGATLHEPMATARPGVLDAVRAAMG
jgi:bifunctional oligoribonuclease and PAP phosphatase NrnA